MITTPLAIDYDIQFILANEDFQLFQNFFEQLIDTISFIHSCGYCYVDFNIGNFLLDNNKNLLLVDFEAVVELGKTPEKGRLLYTDLFVSRSWQNEGYQHIASEKDDFESIIYLFEVLNNDNTKWNGTKEQLLQEKYSKFLLNEKPNAEFMKKLLFPNSFPKISTAENIEAFYNDDVKSKNHKVVVVVGKYSQTENIINQRN